MSAKLSVVGAETTDSSACVAAFQPQHSALGGVAWTTAATLAASAAATSANM